MADIKVAVQGALGRMGRTVLGAVAAEHEMMPVGAADSQATGSSLEVSRYGDLPLSNDLDSLLEATSPDVLVDFTTEAGAMAAFRTAMRRRVRVVSGSTGLSSDDHAEVEALVQEAGVGAISASNFALGAVVLMHLAKIAARYFDYADLLESHHEAKVDAPSGTALSIARALIDGRGRSFEQSPTDKETLAGTRGGDFQGVNIHSARMPGRVASHSLVLGAAGQTLTLAHDSINRESFMPGVMMAVRHVMTVDHLVVGLDRVLGFESASKS